MRIEERSSAERAAAKQVFLVSLGCCFSSAIAILWFAYPSPERPRCEGGKARESHTKMRVLTENMSRPFRSNHSGVPSTFSATADTRAKETLYLIAFD